MNFWTLVNLRNLEHILSFDFEYLLERNTICCFYPQVFVTLCIFSLLDLCFHTLVLPCTILAFYFWDCAYCDLKFSKIGLVFRFCYFTLLSVTQTDTCPENNRMSLWIGSSFKPQEDLNSFFSNSLIFVILDFSPIEGICLLKGFCFGICCTGAKSDCNLSWFSWFLFTSTKCNFDLFVFICFAALVILNDIY